MLNNNSRSVGTIAEIPEIGDNRTVRIIAGRCIESDSLTSVSCFCWLSKGSNRRTVQNSLSGSSGWRCAVIVSNRESNSVIPVVRIWMLNNYASSVRAVTKIPEITNNTTIRIITATSIKRNNLACVDGFSRLGEGSNRRPIKNSFNSCCWWRCPIIISYG